jgi:hypothetical protein
MAGTGGPGPADSRAETSRTRPARPRPSTRPARLMVGAGAIAALTVIGSGLVRFPVASDDVVATTSGNGAGEADAGSRGVRSSDAKASKARARTKRAVKYVRLKPGQKAPKGAKVIREAAPTPRIVVRRTAPAPAPAAAQRTRVKVVTRTRQSG